MADLADLDHEARNRATDSRRSFIVQAPAGSGKTSLLTHRFLRLLAEVARPEEIIAITFTRKAAAEMRQRIIAALASAHGELPGDAGEHERKTQSLARAALAHGQQLGWDLQRHPSRLHIQTIDGLNHWLASRLPLSARLGLSPGLVDNAEPLYREAARRFGSRIEQDDALAEAIARLARLLDHDPAELETLLAAMLERREIWLPKLLELGAAGDMRRGMERLLAAACESALARIRASLEAEPVARILRALQVAARRDPDGPLAAFAAGADLPAPRVEARHQWLALGDVLLTGAGEVRKTVNRTHGFPPEHKAAKAEFVELLQQLAAQPVLVSALRRICELPPTRFTETQWFRVAALCEALVPAAAELQAVLGERGLADHAAVAAAARQALGSDEAPSELALALEYRIRHILVDEYQDTSPVQHRLLERLVAGWQPDDGHSLFCVGDPMQSIYGFREADVTLFLEAQARGIGGVRLEQCSLTRNFRSCRSLVDWVNAVFGRLLPQIADYESGAVPYTASAGTRADEAGAGVTLNAQIGRDEARGAAAVADAVEQSLAEIRRLEAIGPAPEPATDMRSIAVLVRSRGSLPPILAELRRRGVDYRGLELEALRERAAVRDLLALARALLHPGDRTAWLAILRAPWCGLSLADLHALAAPDRQATILSRLGDPDVIAGLSPTGRQQVARLLPCVSAAIADHGRRSLGSWVRSCWLALAGPATLDDPSDLDNAECCFAALDALGIEAGPVPAASEIEAAVAGVMASPVGSAAARVQLMTIHRAKGLEFDTVIMPELERTVSADRRQLLYWAPVSVESGARSIVLASRGGPDEARDGDPLEGWMRRLEKDRARLELGRLAYVAATRARRRLHLVGAAGVSWTEESGPVLEPPRDGSLLRFFWPVVSPAFERRLQEMLDEDTLAPPADRPRPRRAAPELRRLPPGFTAPQAPRGVRASGTRRRAVGNMSVRPQFEWAGEEAIAVGTLLHAELERLARERLPLSALVPRPERWRDALSRMSLPASRQAGAIARVGRAVERLARSEIAARLLDPAAAEAASELGLTAWLDGEFVSVKIDRTFVDAEGLRWIVDWKAGSHEGAALTEFLAHELERYAPQLERYARVMALYDPRPQRVGLYFPMLDAWQEWHG